MGNMMTRFPSYAPTYGSFPQYNIWGESILMYFFVIITTLALATVSIMDTNASANSNASSVLPNMVPAVQLPAVSGGKGGNKKNHKSKH